MPDLVGVSRATWSDYENSKTEPKFEPLITIADFFGISIDLLLRYDISTDAHLIEKIEAAKNQKDAHPNAHLNAPLKGKIYQPNDIITLANEPEETQAVFIAEVKRSLREIRQDIDELKKNLNK